jgi:hypothetical protein
MLEEARFSCAGFFAFLSAAFLQSLLFLSVSSA